MGFADVAKVGLDIFISVGPSISYLDQILAIRRNKDSRGFSLDVCGVLLGSALLRIFFWFGEKFETALFIQSCLLFCTILWLLYLCVLYRPKHDAYHDEIDRAHIFPTPVNDGQYPNPFAEAQDPPTISANPSFISNVGVDNTHNLPPRLKTHRRWGGFWQWTSYGAYCEFLIGAAAVLALGQLIFGGMEWYVTLIGMMSLGLESTLPIPQALSNYRQRSLKGFRPSVLVSWVVGDVLKLGYVVATNTPWQFKACAVFQISVDFVILYQAWIYRHNTGVNIDSVKSIADPQIAIDDDEDLEAGVLETEEPPDVAADNRRMDMI